MVLQRDSRVWVGGHNLHARRAVEALLHDARRPAEGPLDAAFITPNSPGEAAYFAAKLLERMAPHAVLWLVREAGAPDVADTLSALGLRHIRTAQIDSNLQAEAFERTSAP